MKWIIEADLINDEGEWVEIHEEFTNRCEFDRRYSDLLFNYDEPIHWRIEK